MVRGTVSRRITFAHIAKDGEPGVPGPQGTRGPYIPTPRLWTDYPSGYGFQSGAEGEERLDVVLVESGNKVYAYKCISAHTKRANAPTATGEINVYWTVADAGTYQLLATKVLLADNAFIRLLASNGIRIYDASGNIIGAMTGKGTGTGTQVILFIGGMMSASGTFTQTPQFAVSSAGVAYFGGLTGQRVEIDPGAKEMRFYDTSGALCATHGGRTLSVASDVPAMSAVAATNAAASSIGLSTSTQGQSTVTRTVSQSSSTNPKPGRVRVTVPGYTVTVKNNAVTPASGDTSSEESPSTWVTVKARIKTGGTVRSTVLLGEVSTGSDLAGGATSSGTVDGCVLECPVPANSSWAVEVVFEVSIAGGKKSGGSASATASGTASAQFVVSANSHQYQANGGVHSMDSENCFYHLFDSDNILRMKARSNGLPLLGPCCLFKGLLYLPGAGGGQAIYGGSQYWMSWNGADPHWLRSGNCFTLELAPWNQALGVTLGYGNLHVSVIPQGTTAYMSAMYMNGTKLEIRLFKADGTAASSIMAQVRIDYFPDWNTHRI